MSAFGSSARRALLVVGLMGSVAAFAADRPGGTVRFETDQGSDFSVRRSPADGSLLIDLQGSLWLVPAKGGVAKRITPDLFEGMRPDWSADGRQIAVQSYADGMWHIWLVSAEGTRRRQLTRGAFDDTQPHWLADGRIAFLSERGGAPAIWTVDPASGVLAPLAAKLGRPQGLNRAPDGRLLVIDGGKVRLVAADGAVTEVATQCKGGAWIAGAALSPSGRRLAYVCTGAQYGRLMLREVDGTIRELGSQTDAFAFAPQWQDEDRLLYSANGKIRTIAIADGAEAVIPFKAAFRLQRSAYARKRYDFDAAAPQPVKGIVAPSLSPDGTQILFKALNDLWIADRTGKAHRLTEDGAYESDPAWSRGGGRIAYASDVSGLMQLHVREVASGAVRQVTHGTHAATAPSWAPDGTRLAYQTETGETRIVELASGADRALVSALDFPSRPSWSADGRTIAFAAADQGRNRILLVDVASGRQRWIDGAPFRSISTRGDDGPVWSPDGKWLAFSMMSTIWALPVGPDGTPAGPARQLSREASDAPSWSGDSRSILYLANGRLKIVDRETGRVEAVPLDLAWHPERPTGRILVHAGRLWDGVHPAVRETVDIVVAGNRIERIVPHGSHDGFDRIVDAGGQTVTPGLFEMHNHQQLRSKYLGDRQGRLWLAYGITSTRSTGDPAYRALEDREALAAGARIGPRHFMTGEMLEGSRPMWSFSRPVEDEAQLALELSRAEALSYDVIKTYMRFRSDWQAKVADFGHRRLGVSTTSHFSFPGVAHGVDGEEHLSGPHRWAVGFPHLFRGNLYDDYFLALERSGLELTTTNFAGRQELLDFPGLTGDRRLKALYPPWEMASLKEFVGCAARTGPCNFFLTPDEEQSRLTAKDLIRIARGGGRIMIGSDAPLDSFVVSSFQNLYALQKFGLSPFEALQTATRNPARAQGVEADLGSIEAGKLADLVFVEGRPDADIRDLMRVQAVMKAGTYYRVDDLIGPYATGE